MCTCSTCYAEVKTENYENHQDWHENIREYIQSVNRGWGK